MSAQILQPAHWSKPKGYANGIAVRGRQVFVAGQVGWNARQRFESERFADQVRQTLENIVGVLAEADGKPEHIVRFTWFVTSRDEYYAQLPEVGVAYREVMGCWYPPMSVVQVVALMEKQAKVEIEATAVIPDTDT